MEDSFYSTDSRRNSEVTSFVSSKKVSKKCLVASGIKSFSHKSLDKISSLNNVKIGKVSAGHLTSFLLEVAALEMVRRFSKARCPYIWSGLQALQILCYPPFKWIQRWNPFGALVKGMQILSRPLLVLSVATAFSDLSECCNVISDDIEDSDASSDSDAVPESHSEFPSGQSTTDTRIADEAPQSLLPSKNWLFGIYTELEKQGISLPERINEDELHRFYSAANGDFPCFLSLVKKTIHWRETYKILCAQELEMWSNLVFWHGSDVMHRPCLIVRLGLACIGLPSSERPRIAQAIVSQVEHGVLHLVDSENPQITVLVDCEGLSPLRIPMQIVRSCSSLLQDNFPDRLGCLFVIRLPPVVRVLAQTFIQVLKPVTRQKLKIEGGLYQKLLSEYLQTVPSYLGGTCKCTRCAKVSVYNMQQPHMNEETNIKNTNSEFIRTLEDLPSLPSSLNCETDMHIAGTNNCEQVLRTAVVAILILWAFIALMAGMYDPESRPALQP
ncbi:hypothetical protein LguiA_020983 [Lonicera macranthoides]